MERDIRIILSIIFLTVVFGVPLYKFLKGIFSAIKNGYLTNPYADEKAENTKLWDDLHSKDWGFEFVEGDLDGYPDADLFFEFTKPLTEPEQKEITKIFKEWYRKGFIEINKEGSEFGGLMHFMMDKPTFKGSYGYQGFDFGTVSIEKALSKLFKTLSIWNKGRIKKVVFGNDEEIGNKIFPNKLGK